MKSLIDQNLLNDFNTVPCNEHSLLYKMLPAALANVPFHTNTAAVTRYVADGFPFHLAVHKVSVVITPPPEYTQPHWHDEHDEINIILSEESLLYKIHLGGDIFTVENNTSIWIPRGMLHAANVLEGSGFFITMRIQKS